MLQPAEKKPHSLRFIDYLRMLPSSWVFEYFLKKDGSRRTILSSNALLEGAKNFSRVETLRRRFESLELDQRLACSLAYLHGEIGLSADRSGSDHLKNPLVRSFLVYAGRNTSGAVRYLGFPEFEPALRPFCAKTLADAGALHGTAPGVDLSGGGTAAAARQLNDMAVVAVLALQGVLKKRKKGGLTNDALHAVAALTHAGHDCPAGLLLYCGLNAGILKEDDAGYSLAPDGFEAWLSTPFTHRLSSLASCAAGFAGSWNVELLRETFSRLDGTWLSCRIFPEHYRAAAVIALRQLRWAGTVTLARAGRETVFGGVRDEAAPTPLEKNGAVVVLPDFTVVIGQETTPEQLYTVGLFGTLQSLDQVYKGVIDRKVINDSLARGVASEALLGSLASWRAPSNVIATVREWIREFHRLYLTDGPVLVVADEKVAFEIGSYGPLRGCLEPVPAHALFRIRRGAEAAVKDILKNIGFDCRMPCRDPEPENKKERPETGILLPERWEPVVSPSKESPAPPLRLPGRKYGTGLKVFDLNETMHVIEYAILTGQRLMVDYGGSPLLRKGLYVVAPDSVSSGTEPLLEGTLNHGRKKRILVRRISRIGIGAS
jgi:hypothetical protein